MAGSGNKFTTQFGAGAKIEFVGSNNVITWTKAAAGDLCRRSSPNFPECRLRTGGQSPSAWSRRVHDSTLMPLLRNPAAGEPLAPEGDAAMAATLTPEDEHEADTLSTARGIAMGLLIVARSGPLPRPSGGLLSRR